MLPSNVIEKHNVYHALLFQGLQEHLLSIRQSDIGEELLAALNIVSKINLQAVLNNATPFFWLNLKRFYKRNNTITATYLVIQSIDSFLGYLPVGFSVKVYPHSQRLVFPKNNSSYLIYHSLQQTCNISISHNDIINVFPSDTVRKSLIPTNDTCFYHISKRKLHITFTNENDVSIFDEFYANDIVTSIESASTIKKQIEDACELILVATPDYFDEISMLLEWCIPIKHADINTHNSFTSAMLGPVIFLSEASNTLKMSEAIIHETGHVLLNMLMDYNALFFDDYSEQYYSPWRNDPRPISGLIHALYVFCRVDMFLKQVELRGVIPPKTMQKHRILIGHRLLLGSMQINDHVLTKSGLTLMTSIREHINSLKNELNLNKTNRPTTVDDHIYNWKLIHHQFSAVDL